MASRLGTPLTTGIFGGGTQTTISATLTTPAGSITDPCIVVGVLFGDSTAAISSVTVTPSGGSASSATHVASGGTPGTTASHAVAAYRLVGALATNTSHTITITLGAGAEVWGYAEVLQDVDQTTPARGSAGDWKNWVVEAGSGGTITVAPLSDTGDLVFSFMAANGTTLLTDAGDQTDIATAVDSDTKQIATAPGANPVSIAYSTPSEIAVGLVAVSFQSPAGGTQQDVSVGAVAGVGAATTAVARHRPFAVDTAAGSAAVTASLSKLVPAVTVAPVTGVGAAYLTMAARRALTTTAAGTATTTVAVSKLARMGVAAGSATTAVTLTLFSQSELSVAAAAGTSTASAGVGARRNVTVATAGGSSTTSATVTTQRTATVVVAPAAGSATASATLVRVRSLEVGTAAGVGGATAGSPAVLRNLSATSDGASTTQITLNAIYAPSIGTSAGAGTVTVTIGNTLADLTGKYATEHAGAYADVAAIESGDFSTEHGGAYADLLAAGL